MRTVQGHPWTVPDIGPRRRSPRNDDGRSVACASHTRRRMAPWNLPEPLAEPRPSRSLRALRSLAERIRGSTWPPIAIRVSAVVVALVVLGWIGRTAAAGAAPSPAPTARISGADVDGGAAAPLLSPLDASAAPAAVALGAAPVAASRSSRASPSEPVFVNHAGVDELRRLPGVGPKRAEAILALRQRLGRFQRVEDLLRVKGVGRNTVKKWRPLLRLDAPGPEGAADAGSR